MHPLFCLVAHGVVLVLVLALPAAAADPGASAEDMNRSNSPLTPAIGLNLQNQHVGSLHDLSDVSSNTSLPRATIPHRTGGLPQLLRLTVPVNTSPDFPGTHRTTGVGDINLFDIFLFPFAGLEVGIGPQLTVPVNDDDRVSARQYQAGLAVTAIYPQPRGLLGALVTYQHSVGRSRSLPTQSSLQLQPFVIYNMRGGFYLRSSAICNFDLARDTYSVPVGLGIGKVWRLPSGMTVNVFAEPQLGVIYDDETPRWQFFMGVNLQLPIRPEERDPARRAALP